MDLTLDSITDRTDRIREFRFVAPDGAPLQAWSAGAHVDFDLGGTGTRSYSLIDWGGDTSNPEAYVIAVQREDQGEGGSKAMHALPVGSTISCEAPKNDFELVSSDATIYLLAGGIGVTPLVSMAASLSADSRSYRFAYACRSQSAAAYVDELSGLCGDRFTLFPDDAEAIDLQRLAQDAATDNAHLYICGPKPMIDAARSAAEAAGIPAEKIHVELFSTPDAPSGGDEAFEVEIHDTGQVFTIPPGQNIISVLNAAGIDLIYDCQRGD